MDDDNLNKSKQQQFKVDYLGIDRLLASPTTTLFSNLIPGVFRYARTTANN